MFLGMLNEVGIFWVDKKYEHLSDPLSPSLKYLSGTSGGEERSADRKTSKVSGSRDSDQ